MIGLKKLSMSTLKIPPGRLKWFSKHSLPKNNGKINIYIKKLNAHDNFRILGTPNFFQLFCSYHF